MLGTTQDIGAHRLAMRVKICLTDSREKTQGVSARYQNDRNKRLFNHKPTKHRDKRPAKAYPIKMRYPDRPLPQGEKEYDEADCRGESRYPCARSRIVRYLDEKTDDGQDEPDKPGERMGFCLVAEYVADIGRITDECYPRGKNAPGFLCQHRIIIQDIYTLLYNYPMAARRIAQLGNPALKAFNQPVTDFASPIFKKLVSDLKNAMIEHGLVGIAAPQIAENYRVFVTYPRTTGARKLGKSDIFRVYVNPVLVHESKETSLIYEGCGSVARGEIFGPVVRPREITIKAQDETGSFFSLRCNGLLGRVIQHEYDHLGGIEFTEKIIDYSKLLSRVYYRKHIRNSPDQLKASAMTVVEYKRLSDE